jgi:hypothetical protein
VNRLAIAPRPDEVVRDPSGRRPRPGQPLGGSAVGGAAAVPRQRALERGRGEAVPEAIQVARLLDDQRLERRVEHAEGLLLGEAGERGELVGRELPSQDRDPRKRRPDVAAERSEPRQHDVVEPRCEQRFPLRSDARGKFLGVEAVAPGEPPDRPRQGRRRRAAELALDQLDRCLVGGVQILDEQHGA